MRFSRPKWLKKRMDSAWIKFKFCAKTHKICCETCRKLSCVATLSIQGVLTMKSVWLAVLSAFLLAACAAPSAVSDAQVLQQQVSAAETAFAKSMADRDLNAFASFIAEDAVFLNGGKPLRGKAAIVEFWKRFFTAKEAPFSWKPELVQVLPTGGLAHSSGPVSAGGKQFANFYSTWRREADGSWKVVLDNGYDVCDCTKKQ
jgi:ketosteroid isomerase-like protein